MEALQSEQLMGRFRLRSLVLSWPTALATVVVFQAVLSFRSKPGVALSTYTLIPYFLLLVLATVVALVNALQRTLGQRPFWAFLAAGFGLWALDSWLWIYYELILRQKIPDNSITDPILFLHAVAFLAALATRPDLGQASLRRHQTTLNFLLVLLFWAFLYAFLVFPFQFLPENSTVYNLRFNILYFTENLALMMTLGALLILARAPWKSVYWHLLGATGVYTTGSLAANTAIDLGGYYPGHWTDFVIIIAICWFVWIPLRAREHEAPTHFYSGTKVAGLQATTILAMLVVIMIPVMGAWDLFQTEEWWIHRLRILVALCFMTILASAAFIKRYAENRELNGDVLLIDEKRLKSQQRFLELLESVEAIIWEADAATLRVTFVSRGAEKLLGHSRLQWVRTAAFWADHLHPDDRDRALACEREVLEKGKALSVEYRMQAADGQYLWFRDFMHSVPGPDGKAGLLRGIMVDITATHLAEEALRESEDRYRDLVEHSQDLICTHDLTGRLLSVNRAPAGILGYTPEELLRIPLQELLAPEVRNEFDEYLEKIRREDAAQGLMVVQTRSGERRIWKYHNTLRTEGVPEPIVRGMARDVTERHRAEKALRESQTRLELIARASNTGLWDWDLRTNTVYYSPEWKSQVGCSEHEISNRFEEWESRVHPEDLPAAIGRLRNYVTHPQGEFENEFRFRHKDGSYRWILSRASVLNDSEGEPLRMLGSHLDITERKRAEQALQEYEKVVEASQDMIAVLDREYRYLLANRAFLDHRGMERGQVIGRTVPEVLDKDVFERVVKERFDECLRGEPVQFEMKYTYPVLGERDLFVRYFPISGAAGVDRVACVLADITERKRLEQQFLQSQKLEAVGRLVGGVAHDFNNLLTAINGYSQLLLGRVESTGTVHDFVARILKAGERAASLTQQLLAFSRKQVMVPMLLDLNAVLENMEEMLRRLIGEDVELATIPGVQLGQVRADPTQIEQVIMNLAVNARDAMPRGGKLTIETRNVELDESYTRTQVNLAPGRYVLLSICDSGLGMDAETLAHIFEPFFTTKELGKGTGLGLSTVYGIVKQTGGHVGVHSEVGQGTTFKVYLPRLDKPVELAEKPVDEAGLSGSETILVVEDEADVRMLIQSVLESQGYSVILASSPIEAVTLSERHAVRIHLLLTDVVMPGFSGMELAEHLTSARPEMEVLFISGYTADAITRHGVLDEKTQLLQKPFTPIALLRKVRETIERRIQ
jgi:two-component system cell cycle sensor histidine kinase/response regulator CckA